MQLLGLPWVIRFHIPPPQNALVPAITMEQDSLVLVGRVVSVSGVLDTVVALLADLAYPVDSVVLKQVQDQL